MEAGHGDDWSTSEEDRTLTSWLVSTLNKCFRRAMLNDANKFEVLKNVMLKSSDLLRIIDSDTEAGSLTVSYVCPHCGLFLIEDFIWWVTEEHIEKTRGGDSAIGGVQRVEDSTTGEEQTVY